MTRLKSLNRCNGCVSPPFKRGGVQRNTQLMHATLHATLASSGVAVVRCNTWCNAMAAKGCNASIRA